MTLVLAFLCFMIPLVCGAIIALKIKEVEQLQEKLKDANRPKPIDVQIRELKELATLEAQCVLIASDKDSCSLFEFITIPGTTRGFVLTLTATAVWGCDLNKAKRLEKSSAFFDTVQIVVPHCHLMRFYEEPNSRKVIFEQNGFFAHNSIDVVNNEVQRALRKAREDTSNDRNQQKLADQTLKLILTTIANASDSSGSKVDIIFDDEITNYDSHLQTEKSLPGSESLVVTQDNKHDDTTCNVPSGNIQKPIVNVSMGNEPKVKEPKVESISAPKREASVKDVKDDENIPRPQNENKLSERPLPREKHSNVEKRQGYAYLPVAPFDGDTDKNAAERVNIAQSATKKDKAEEKLAFIPIEN